MKHKYVSKDCIRYFAQGFTGKIPNAIQCIQKLSDLLRKDHLKGKNPFVDEVALNLDLLEEYRVKGHTTKLETVDYILGLDTNWILLVEAKLDADKPDRFVTGLKGKWSHSRELVRMSDYEVYEGKEYVILMKDKNFEQNKDRLRNLACGLPNIKPMKIADFHSEYFSQK